MVSVITRVEKKIGSSVISEPGKNKMTVRNSVVTKFETKIEQETDPKEYAERKSKTIMWKTTKDLIQKHVKTL